MLKFYQAKIFPRLLDKVTGKPELIPFRTKLLEQVSGDILEIGLGTGANLKCYPKSIQKITAIDPYIRELPKSELKIEFFAESIEKNSFADNSFDTVVSTFTLCSTQNLELTLFEIHRVLKPQGKFLFLEHGRASKRLHQQMQKIINPVYTIFACGCNLTREYQNPILNASFELEEYQMHINFPFSPKWAVGNLISGLAIKKVLN